MPEKNQFTEANRLQSSDLTERTRRDSAERLLDSSSSRSHLDLH